MSEVIIWGSGGFAREVNMLCDQAGVRVLGFLDERADEKGRVVDGLPILGTLADVGHLRKAIGVVCAGVGDPALKLRFVQITTAAGFKIADPIVHPMVQVSRRNAIGPGSIVCSGVVMTVNVRIGSHVIVNLNTTIGHDVAIGDLVTIAPGVNVSGNVTIEEGASLGTNAAIREKLHIHEWAVIGGGSFVREDVPARTLYAGVPATLKKHL